jgi:GntR family transcriptional regulator
MGTTNASPRYVELANSIRHAIERGEFQDQDALPSERDLATRFGVSRETVRKAIQVMRSQGVVYSDHGRGNFVGPALVRSTVRLIESFSEDVRKRGATAGQTILEVSRGPATRKLSTTFDVSEGTPLWRVTRVRHIDGIPVGLHDSYLLLPSEALLSSAEIQQAGSLYSLLEAKFGFTPAEAIESLYALAATARDAELLNTKTRTPLLVCERITLSDRRTAIEYCLMKYAPQYRYQNRVVAV